MSRWASGLLLASGVLLLLSAAAHAFLGWPAIRQELRTDGVADDLVQGIGFGWLYGSAAMLTFGVLAIAAWRATRTGRLSASGIAAAIGTTYIAFGTWALLASSLNPHFFGFIGIGALLAAAAYGLRHNA